MEEKGGGNKEKEGGRIKEEKGREEGKRKREREEGQARQKQVLYLPGLAESVGPLGDMPQLSSGFVFPLGLLRLLSWTPPPTHRPIPG